MTASKNDGVDVAALRSSPIHDLKPVSDTPQLLDVEAVEDDETNPGAVTESLRYRRREPSIRDSFDIIGGIVYPIIVCQHTDEKKRQQGLYINVDGHGRRDQVRRRNEAKIWAIVYPPMTLEQRICMRQTLGAAQESFDAVSVMQDLRTLAEERKLDLRNQADLAVLVRDLPEKVRKYEDDLLMLARWDQLESSAILGESYKKDAKTIGLDKVRGLTRVVDAVKSKHPALYETLSGDSGITRKLAKMYVDKKFSTGSRSQEAIRKVASAIRELPEDDSMVGRFFIEELDHAVLAPYAKTRSSAPKDMVSACEPLMSFLLTADAADLTEVERRALARVDTLVRELIAPPRAAEVA